jgi:hypothetical protein
MILIAETPAAQKICAPEKISPKLSEHNWAWALAEEVGDLDFCWWGWGAGGRPLRAGRARRRDGCHPSNQTFGKAILPGHEPVERVRGAIEITL